MEVIAALHAQLQAVSGELDRAEGQTRSLEEQKRSLVNSNERIKRQVRDEGKKMVQLRTRESALLAELEGQQVKSRQSRQMYASAFFSLRQLPSAFDNMVNEYLSTATSLSADISHLTSEVLHIAQTNDLIENDLIPKNDELLDKIIRVRSQRAKAAQKELDFLNAQLRGTANDMARLEKKLSELKAASASAPQQEPSRCWGTVPSHGPVQGHSSSLRSHHQYHNEDVNGADECSSPGQGLQPSKSTPSPRARTHHAPYPTQSQFSFQPPLQSQTYQTHQAYSTTTQQIVEQEVVMYLPASFGGSMHEPWYREHRKRRRQEVHVEGPGAGMGHNTSSSSSSSSSRVMQDESGAAEVDIYSIC